MKPSCATLGWLGVLRLGLVQSSLGAIIVLATSTLNRVMVVEYALPAVIPGVLVALHYVVQMLRPRFGHGSDVSGRRTPWIIGGMTVLAIGGIGAALATALLPSHRVIGIAALIVAYAVIGVGVGAAGTALLVLLASAVAPARRAGAATVLWIMMIAGFAITSGVAGHFLDPFSGARLIRVVGIACLAALAISIIAVAGVERTPAHRAANAKAGAGADFLTTLRAVWAEPETRRFTHLLFVSMLAYSGLELILEPFAGIVFSMTPGASTRLSGLMHGGAVLGMLLIALAGSVLRFGSLRGWLAAGCVASAASLGLLAAIGAGASTAPLRAAVFALGLSTGAFAVSAIASMMDLAASYGDAREGVRMGLWGSAQAIAFAVGGIVGTAGIDVARHLLHAPGPAYALVFVAEALLFLAAARIALRHPAASEIRASRPLPVGQFRNGDEPALSR